MMSTAIDLSSDVQRVAHLLDVLIEEAGKGFPALAMNNRLPSILEVEQAEYMRLLLLAAADGLVTTIAQRGNDGANKEYVHFPYRLTEAGEHYLDAWRTRGKNDRHWATAWLALEKSEKPHTPANMLGCLRARAKGPPNRAAKLAY